MRTLVLDIETVGVDFESLDGAVQRYLLKYAEQEPTEEQRDAARARVRDSLALWAPTGRVIAVAMLNPDTCKARVYYEGADDEPWTIDEGVQAEFIPCDERTALERVWEVIPRYPRLVTFNGRGFDLPFLMLRSSLQGLKPSRNLLGNRYGLQHVDLLDQLTFHGLSRKFSLDFWCKAYGIASPKAAGVEGADVGRLYREGRLHDIARYCLGDTVATANLYARWHATLCFGEQE